MATEGRQFVMQAFTMADTLPTTDTGHMTDRFGMY
jgi:hypothetical protein